VTPRSSLLARPARWLARHPVCGWSLVAAFTAFNILSHNAVQSIAGWLGEQLTIERLSLIVTAGGLLAGAALLAILALRLRRHPAGVVIAAYGLATLALIAVAYNTLFMINTEAIHFPQYALMGMIVFPLVGRVAESITWVTLFGAFDEAWQYWVLNSEVDFAYFDFNDIVLNLLGAAMGVLLAAALLGDTRERGAAGYGLRDFARSPALAVTGAFVAAGAVLWMLGPLSVLPGGDAWVVLMRSGAREAYWETSYWGKTAHVLLPLEGLVVTFALLALYLPLDRRIRWRLP